MRWGLIYITVILALFVRFFILSAFKMPNENMAPVFLAGDYILAFKNEFNRRSPFSQTITPVREPQRGELVIFTKNSKTLIRRVIALPGEKIEIKNNTIAINNIPCQYANLDVPQNENQIQRLETCMGQTTALIEPENALLALPDFGERILEKNEFLVLSDHRAIENNSNVMEIIQFDQIIGKPWLIWMSYGSTQDFISDDKSIRWNRILTKPI